MYTPPIQFAAKSLPPDVMLRVYAHINGQNGKFINPKTTKLNVSLLSTGMVVSSSGGGVTLYKTTQEWQRDLGDRIATIPSFGIEALRRRFVERREHELRALPLERHMVVDLRPFYDMLLLDGSTQTVRYRDELGDETMMSWADFATAVGVQHDRMFRFLNVAASRTNTAV